MEVHISLFASLPVLFYYSCVLVLFFNILQEYRSEDIKVFFDTGQRFRVRKMFSQVSLYSPRLHLLDQK